ncbi:BamA/TamA family outer membrane protein [Histidinibacterium aquaticum]|uniref:BamA/TamA family outer membrane protein n=1 Tax=Histidinibacterium aquaticum TaxID=2613962 RepID=A0A5J5GMR2_9RHOB|nr:BamA/TamA family outer membrane protein [Histidinibacterium aquaticum]KAA9009465.1 BamA/TamA family outer membrane protein [Histidinibacterium aquaticum]
MGNFFQRFRRLALVCATALTAPVATLAQDEDAASTADADVFETGLGEPIGRVSGRLAYNSERGPIVGLGIETTRFLGRDQHLQFAVEADENDTRYRLLTRSDDLFGTQPRLSLLIESRQQSANDNFAFDVSANSARAGLGWTLTDDLDATSYLLVSRDRIYDVAPNASALIEADAGTSDRVAVGGELDYVLRDPESGQSVRLDLGLELGKRDDADEGYLKITGGLAYTQRLLGGDVILNQTLRAGAIDSRGGTSSIGDRFILGSGSIRGFELAGFGPRDLAVGREPALGGNRFVAARTTGWFPNALPDTDRIAPGVFFDAGSLWGLDDTGGGPGGASPVDDDFSLRGSAGVTVRIATGIGRLDISLAHVRLQEDYDETRTVQVSFSQQF